jgi:hypothetical protein
MRCLCHKGQYCPIHKDHPLPQPPEVCHHSYVIKVYQITMTKQWFYTVTKDAIHQFTSPLMTEKPTSLDINWV